MVGVQRVTRRRQLAYNHGHATVVAWHRGVVRHRRERDHTDGMRVEALALVHAVIFRSQGGVLVVLWCGRRGG